MARLSIGSVDQSDFLPINSIDMTAEVFLLFVGFRNWFSY